MRIAICEDLPEEARLLSKMIGHYLRENRLDAEIERFESGEEFLSAFAPGKYQIIFMDIYMKKSGLSGMEAAGKASRADREAAIIFVTDSREHFQAGYDFGVYYIVKPVDEEKLAKAMTKCQAQLQRFAKTIEVIADRQPVKIKLWNIFAVESIGRSCVFRFSKEEITVSNLLMDELMAKLGGLPFIKCHRSYIVNLLHVKEMRDKEFILENGSSVPIGRKHQDAARIEFRKYFWKTIQGDMV